MAAGTERAGQGEGAASPLLEALHRQLSLGHSRLHMPGHKGVLPFPLGEAARYDLTELPGTDSLYEAGGCLQALELRYASLYGAKDSFLSAGGSTLCIQTMLALLGPDASLCCDRNIHTSAMNAMGLLGQRPFFLGLRRDRDGLPLPPSPGEVAEMLRRHPQVKAVYLTSPNYYGYLADIRGIAAAVLEVLPPCPALPGGDRLPELGEPEMGCIPREAMLAESERIAVKDAQGRIAAANVQRCPPGVPLVLCGERISEETILLLKSYGVLALNVIK